MVSQPGRLDKGLLFCRRPNLLLLTLPLEGLKKRGLEGEAKREPLETQPCRSMGVDQSSVRRGMTVGWKTAYCGWTKSCTRKPWNDDSPCKYHPTMVSHGFNVVQDFVHPQYVFHMDKISPRAEAKFDQPPCNVKIHR